MKPLRPALFIGVLGLTGCSPPSPPLTTTSTEQAGLLPQASEIRAIKVVGDKGRTTDIPAEYSPAIVALFNSGSRDHDPAKWEGMGYDLAITTKTGKTINIFLFRTNGRKGAFAIGSSWEDRTYYRGSTDEAIATTIEKAKRASKK